MAVSLKPISIAEFLASFTRLGVYRWRSGIGICVSGGPDSMALAALFSKARRSNLDLPLGLKSVAMGPMRAFIVDHQAREGSAEEAKMVASRLESLGLDSEVLQMPWPDGVHPTQMLDFETRARKQRYRILARAAIRNNISNLYLGHHQDDQVETMLMRMTQPRETWGLMPKHAFAGIRQVAPIPCCNDIYGASDAESDSGYPDDGQVYQAHTGISLVRPFLNYPKSRLEATCKTMGVPHFIDKTNLDPTRTRRNTIRHLMANHCLPRALQKAALVKTHDRIREDVHRCRPSHSSALWDQLSIHRFDLTSGMLIIEFPNRLDLICKEPLAALAYVLKDLLDAVSPISRGCVSLSTGTAKHIFRILNQSKNEGLATISQTAVTAAGVMIESSVQTLRLYRQPLRRGEHVQLAKSFVADSQACVAGGWSWTEWLLWDNRYWLRCKVHTSDRASEYSVRAFTDADVAPTKSRLRERSASRLRTFEETLEDAAPGKIRFTLPVIVRHGHILAFPTLDFSLQALSAGDPWQDPSLGGRPWEVRFKRQGISVRRAWQRCHPDAMVFNNESGIEEEGEHEFCEASEKQVLQ